MTKGEVIGIAIAIGFGAIGTAVYIGNIEGRLTALEGDKDFQSIIEAKSKAVKEIGDATLKANEEIEKLTQVISELNDYQDTAQKINVATLRSVEKIEAASIQAIDSIESKVKKPTYTVIGVFSDDVLNMRSGPGPDNEIVGSLPPNTKGIRLIGDPLQIGGSFWIKIFFDGVEGWGER